MAGPLDGLVTHKFVQTNGIKMHYVEAGSGPTVLLLHGFPDFWYSWRHQIPAFVAAGYHVIAPDHRGVGETEIPDSVDKYSELHHVGDIIGLLDALELKQVLVVAHDWGAAYGSDLALFRPDRVKALALLGLSYIPRVQEVFAVDILRKMMGNDMYISVFQTPGVAEEIFKKAKNEDIFSAFYLRWNSTPNLAIPPFIENEPLPDWLSKEDLKIYAAAFDKTGWTGALNQYRAMKLSWELKAPWTKAPLPAEVPVMLMMGRQDLGAAFFGIKTEADEEPFFAKSRLAIPGLKAHCFIDASHFLHQEKSNEVNQLVLDFLKNYKC
ncbi:unnamed protein product [Calypogeia fissa]